MLCSADRLLDFHIRQRVWHQVHKHAKFLWLQDGLDDSLAKDLGNLMENLHMLPTQGRRGKGDGEFGWEPNDGWGGTSAFYYLCMRAPQH